MNRLEKHKEYLFMQDGARAHTAKLTLEMLKARNKSPKLLEPHHRPPNNPDWNPVDFEIWRLLEQNIYQGQRINDLDSLKEAIIEE